jgi:transcriptional regulator with XRE-family HTH domain
MTLKELAVALGHAAHGYISELESGKKTPTVELVLSVSQLFGVTTDELLRDDLELKMLNGQRRSRGGN